MKDLEELKEYTNVKGERLKVFPSGINTYTCIYYPNSGKELFLVGDLKNEHIKTIIDDFNSNDENWNQGLKWSSEGGWLVVIFWIVLGAGVVWLTYKISF